MKSNHALSILTVVGLLLIAFAILFVIATNRAQHVDSLSNILSSIVSGLLGALGGGAVGYGLATGKQTNVKGDQINLEDKEK